jgi:hypothetical protein
MLAGQIASDPALVLCTLVKQAPGGNQGCNVIQSALPRTGEFAGKPVPQHARERFDPTLGGLVEVSR